MRKRWWKSIRWRLAFGSMYVVIVATLLLALAVIVAIVYYYSVDESSRLANFASESAQRISENYRESHIFVRAVASTFPNVLEQNYEGDQYLVVVLNHRSQIVYPRSATARYTFA